MARLKLNPEGLNLEIQSTPKKQVPAAEREALEKEFKSYRESIHSLAVAVATSHKKLEAKLVTHDETLIKLTNDVSIVDEKVNNSDDEIAVLQNQKLTPVDVKEVVIHRENGDVTELEEQIKNYVDALNDRQFNKHLAHCNQTDKRFDKQEKVNKRLKYEIMALVALNIVTLLMNFL